MKKIIALLCVFLFAGYSLADGAFGVYKGMTRKDLENKGVVFSSYRPDWELGVSRNAPKENKIYTSYSYSFNNAKLCEVSGNIENIKTGEKLKELYDSLSQQMYKKYGKNISSESVLDNAVYSLDELFLAAQKSSLSKGVAYSAMYRDKKNNTYITVTSLVLNKRTAEISVSYDFCLQ